MTEQKKKAYIEKNLQHELRFLLSSVEIWKLFKTKGAGFVVNIPRDSVCVHFRTLLAFFTKQKSGNDISITEFGIENAYKSDFAKWLGKINEAVLHISPKRNQPKDYPKEDLNDQMDNFKIEILRLWERFTQESPKYAPILRQALDKARKEVGDDVSIMRKSFED